MKRWKNVLLSPTFQYPVLAVAILIAVCALYYRFAARHSETAVNERSLRVLAALAEEFSSHLKTLDNIAHKGWPDSALRGQVTELEQRAPCDPKKDDSDRLTVSNDNLHVAVWQNNVEAVNTTGSPSCWVIQFDVLMGALEESLPKGTFEDLLLADGKGHILYQTRRSGMRIADLHPFFTEHRPEPGFREKRQKKDIKATAEPLSSEGGGDPKPQTPEKDDELATTLATSRLTDIELGGERYKLYTVPVNVQVPMDNKFIVAGILHERAFQAERVTPLTNTLVTIGFFVLLVAAGTYPILRFRLMGPTEVLTRKTGFIFVAQVVFTMVMIGGLFGHEMFSHYAEETDTELHRLAQRIEENLATETHLALDMLSTIEKSYIDKSSNQELSDGAWQSHADGKTCSDADFDFQRQVPDSWIPAILTQTKEPAKYPYFDHVFFADRAGYQEIKVSTQSSLTPPVRVCGLEGFRRALSERGLWQFAGEPNSPRFWIDPSYSGTSGQYFAFISRPSSSQIRDWAPVAVMGTALVSVSQPVLPPSYGFAILDREGKVLFHSTPAKNLRENFADACDRSRRLRDLIELRESGIVETSYLGIRHRILVQPVRTFEHSPWSIAVFRDLTSWEEDHFDAVSMFFFLAGSYILLLTLAGLWAGLTKRPPAWIYPVEADRRMYWRIFWVLLLVIFANSYLFFQCDGTELWVTACAVPFISLLFTGLKLRSKNSQILWMAAAVWLLAALFAKVHGTSRPPFWYAFTLMSAAFAALALPYSRPGAKASSRSLASVYAYPATALLVTVGLIPALRLFNASVLFHNVIAARRSELELAEQLEQRNERLNETYLGRYGDEKKAKGDFLTQRINTETRDLYYLYPSAPVKLVAKPASGTQVTLAWPEPASGIPLAGYQILRGDTPSSLSPVSVSAKTYYPDRGLRTSTRYYYAVQAMDAGGNLSAPSRVVSAKTPAGSKPPVQDEAVPGFTDAGGLEDQRLEPLLSFVSSNLLEHDGSAPRHRSGLLAKDTGLEWCQAGGFPNAQLMLRIDGPDKPCSQQKDVLTGNYHNWIVSNLPQQAGMKSVAGAWGTCFLILFLGTIVATFFSLRDAITRLFALDWKRPEPWTEVEISALLDLRDPIFGRHAVLLGAPRSGKTEAFMQRSDVRYINLAEDAKGILDRLYPGPEEVVVLDHLDHYLKNSQERQRILGVLERLIYDARCRVVILATIDPLFYFGNLAKTEDIDEGEISRRLEVDRWTNVLAGFRIVRAKNPCRIEGEPSFALLWQSCTDEERAALCQIAKHGWANYLQAPALSHLYQRGLVKHDRQFELSDPAFGNFIACWCTAEHFVPAQSSGASDTLSVIRIVLVVVGVAFVALLAYLWGDQMVAYAATGASAVTAATRAFAKSRERGRGAVQELEV